MGLLNEVFDSSEMEIGKIDVMKTFTFFEIEKEKGQKAIEILSGKEYRGVSLVVENAQPRDKQQASFSREKPRRNFSRNQGFGNKKRKRPREKLEFQFLKKI